MGAFIGAVGGKRLVPDNQLVEAAEKNIYFLT